MKLTTRDYDELVELIYQIPLSQDNWFSFAQKLLVRLQASYVHIQAIDFSRQVLSFSNGVGPLPLEAYAQAELDYLRYPVEADPRWGKFLDPTRQGWYQCHKHITEDFVEHFDLYQKILLPHDLRYVATHEIIWDEKICVFLSISTSQQRQPLNQKELAFLDQLVPHLKRMVIAQRHLFEFSLDHIIGYNLVDKLTQPIMLCNFAGQIVHLNPTMQSFIKNCSLINDENGKLILPKADQERLLSTLYQIEEKFRYQRHELEDFKNIELLLFDSNLKINIDLLASEKEKSFFGTRPLLMLNFENSLSNTLKSEYFSQQSQYQLADTFLKQHYKLTTREYELCQLFVNRMSLEQAAQHMGLTKSSVRTYLRNVFVKMQCNSQVELMQLLMQMSRSD